MTDTGNKMSFAEFAEKIEKDHREVRHSARRRLLLLGILMVAITVYMSWISREISSIDATSLSQFARGYVLVHLPEMKDSVAQMLKDNAPAVTDQAQRTFLELPRLMREQLEAQLPPGSRALAKHFEKDIDAQLDVAVNAIAKLARKNAKSGTKGERVRQLVGDARAVYHGMVLSVLDDMHKQYAVRVKNLNAELRHLQSGSWLTPKQKLQREIIEATLVLIDRHDMKDAISPQFLQDIGVSP